VVVDWNDPSIEIFPTDRTSILDTIRRLSERLPEDVPDLDIVPPSPVIGPNGQPLEGRSPAPSPAVVAHQISPSLDSITEENDDLQETLVLMPKVSKLTSRNGEKENIALGEWLDDSIAAPKETEKANLDGPHEAVEPESTEIGSEKVATKPSVEVEPAMQAKDEVESKETPDGKFAEENCQPELSNITEVEEATVEKTEESPSVEVPQASGEPELTSKELREERTAAPEEMSSEVNEVGPETPPPEPVEQTSSEKPHIPLPTTPFVVGDRQLGHDDEVREIATDGDSPNITIQPATPAALKTEFVQNPLDAAKSTAIEEENGRQVKSRKNPRSQSPERPITPSSMRSATRDTKSKNILKAFWRVVFVDWIGGLIRALCGGRGGYT
jgi:hypothetical protein